MAGNIATIGFAADTSSLERVPATMARMIPAAQAVEAAADGVANSLANAGGAAVAASTAITGTGASATSARRGIDNMANAASGLAANSNKVTAALQKQTAMQERINALTGVNAGGGGPPGRADDVKAYGQALDDLRAKYDPLFAAGRTYKATLLDINNALKVGALNEKQHSAAIMDTKVAFVEQVNTLTGLTARENAHSEAANKAKAATVGFSYEAKNLSFQLVDVTQGVLSGISPMQIFAQQAGQIGQVLATAPKGGAALFKEIGASIAAVLTPVRLITLGIIGLAGAFIYMGLSTVSGLKALDDMARSVDLSIAKYRELQQTASFKGISTESFNAGIKQFADSVYDAQRNMGGLAGLMAANGMRAKDLQGYMNNVADLVARTSSDMQKQKILREAGLPSDAEWVRYMSQGAAGIAAARRETVGFNADAENNLIAKARAFDDAWNKATTKFGQYFKSAILDAVNAIDQLSPKMSAAMAGVAAAIAVALAPFSLILAGISAVVAAGLAAKAALGLTSSDDSSTRPRVTITGGTTAPKPGGPQPKTQAELLAANQMAQQRLSILGDMATVEEQVRLRELGLAAAGLQLVGVDSQRAKQLINAATAQAQNNLVTQQAQAGVFNLSLAQTAANNTLQMWIDKGIVDKNNTEQMTAARNVLNRSIRDTADAAEIAASNLPGLTRLSLEAGDFSKVLDSQLTSSLNQISGPIQDAMNGVTGFGDAFKNVGVIVLKAIQQMIIQMLIIAPIAKALKSIFDPFLGGAAGGGILSFFSGLFGSKSAKGNAFNDNGITPFARGGAFTNSLITSPTVFKYAKGGAFGLMGEAGPEAVMPLQRGADGSLGVQMYGGNDNGGSSAQINYAPQYNVAQGADPRAIDELRRAQQDDRRNAPKVIADTMIEMRRRGVAI